MNDCIFCKIIKGEIPSTKVYEDEQFLAFLDIKPVNPGHTLVIPKTHYENLATAPAEVIGSLMQIAQKVAVAVQAGTKAPGFNLGVNNGVAAGQLVGHLHVHIMPRLEKDGYSLWHGKPYGSDDEKNNIAEAIRKQLI